MNNMMVSAQNMILIGSGSRNSGKTAMAVAIIRRWREMEHVVGLKVTTVSELEDGGSVCHRGKSSCGACSLPKDVVYELAEEKNVGSEKDTSLMLAAGALPVYWLRARRSHILSGYADFCESVDSNTLVVCESNSLREFVRPGCFILMNAGNTGSVIEKESAARVASQADIVIENASNSADLVKMANLIDVSHTPQDLEVRLKGEKQ
jgi:hypothetical protein